MHEESTERLHQLAWKAAVAGWRATASPIPWGQIPPIDLVEFLYSLGLPLKGVRRILDVGSCDGSRIIHACRTVPELNRADLHVHCVDVCESSVEVGRSNWSAMKKHRTSHAEIEGPRFTVSFEVGSATSIAEQEQAQNPDMLLDWMMLHGLPKSAWAKYRLQIEKLRPRFVLIKCFTTETGGPKSLPQTVPGVEKHVLSDHDVMEFVGAEYKLVKRPMDWSGCERTDKHVDGIEGAKRAYCFERTAG